MVVALPLGKLVALGVKTIAKPLVFRIKHAAKGSPIFRKYICIPPAQAYHWLELNVKMRLMGFKGKAEIKPLKEANAIDLGAELLGECLVFAIAAGTILGEYYRNVRNDRKKEMVQNDKLGFLLTKVEELDLQLQQQSAEVIELQRRLGYRTDSVANKLSNAMASTDTSHSTFKLKQSNGDLSKYSPSNQSQQSQRSSLFSWFWKNDSAETHTPSSATIDNVSTTSQTPTNTNINNANASITSQSPTTGKNENSKI